MGDVKTLLFKVLLVLRDLQDLRVFRDPRELEKTAVEGQDLRVQQV
jgi:hypothetical protein